ncbi:MAG: DUF2279 domain-containing protein [Bacteroidota bacterium]
MRALIIQSLLALSLLSSVRGNSLTDSSVAEKACWLDPSPSPDKQRTRILTIGLGSLYVGSMTWLYHEWYRDYPLGNFRTFNDGSEWEGMDKFAHGWDAYSISKPVFRLFRWAGYDNNRAAWMGAGVAFLFQTTVEVFDGFSPGWGFSTYDLAANTAGTALFLSQQLGWQEQRIVLKYSLRTTPYAAYRPELLGSSVPERILKDYNGLTFWASVSPSTFLRGTNVKWPAWLSLAVGFGAEGMTGGANNPTEVNGSPIPSFERYRQYYLGLDFDLARIQTRHRWLSDIFKLINIVHLPAPALELSPGRRPKWHALYF